MLQDLLSLVPAREGHFRLESGHHGRLWLELETLFVDTARVGPLVDALALKLRAHDVAAVCGPLVGGAFLAQALAMTLRAELWFTERVIPPVRHGLYRAEYHLPRSLRGRVEGKRVAIVDDAISAGSAVRGTYAELQARSAHPVVVATLLALGSVGLSFFSDERVPVIAMAQLPYELWPPGECPLCALGTPLEDVAGEPA
jgi:orotate phosphoribosyltransferase